jgi:hypothetical protein
VKDQKVKKHIPMGDVRMLNKALKLASQRWQLNHQHACQVVRAESLWEHGCQAMNATGLGDLYSGNVGAVAILKKDVSRRLTKKVYWELGDNTKKPASLQPRPFHDQCVSQEEE